MATIGRQTSRRGHARIGGQASAPVSIAFVAQVGRGKSSLISAATRLRLPKDGSPSAWAVLLVGSVRTTLGETRIQFEAREDIALLVDPIPQSELRTELRLFAEDLWKRNAGQSGPSAGDGAAGEELFWSVWMTVFRDDPRM